MPFVTLASSVRLLAFLATGGQGTQWRVSDATMDSKGLGALGSFAAVCAETPGVVTKVEAP